MKRIKLFCSALFLCTLFSLLGMAVEPFTERLYEGQSFAEYAGIADIPEVDGYSAYVYNVETGSVMYQKNSGGYRVSGLYRQAHDGYCGL